MRPNPSTSRIEALAYCFDNADALDIEAAAANLANNCPAFWHRAAGGNAAVTGFIFFLNRTQDIVRAWELYEHEFQRPSKMRDEAMLDHLLPLNAGAVHSLAAAYVALGSFRASRELFARTDKAEDAALDALRALRRTQPAPLIDAIGGLDYSRIDAAARAINREAPSANARLIASAPDLLAALTLCQSALAMMIAPDAIKNTTVLNAFAQANEAEAKSRAALAKAGA